MRYVVLGAGAVGCAIGGLLHQAGRDVVFIARGQQREALAARGLSLGTPERSLHIDVRLGDGVVTRDDVILLATKSQDTEAALESLTFPADPTWEKGELPVVCAQNGLKNEPFVAAQGMRAYGMMVFVPATYLSPGRVTIHSGPCPGVLDIGCFPQGSDGLCERIVADLCAAGYDARVDADVMRTKRGKEIVNLAGVVQALAGSEASRALHEQIYAEGSAVFDRAGLSYVSVEDLVARRCASINDKPVDGASREGGSSWQSLRRGTTLETDCINGELVRLGERHGVPTPLNAALLALAERAEREKWPPAKLSYGELCSLLGPGVVSRSE